MGKPLSHSRTRAFILLVVLGSALTVEGDAQVAQRPALTTLATREAKAVREERSVVIGDTREIWRLRWTSSPKPHCAPDDALGVDVWYTCPCQGFAFGEEGDIELTRIVNGRLIERLPLTPLFADDVIDSIGDKAVLPRWPVRDGDMEDVGHGDTAPPSVLKRIHSRTPVRVMRMRDYDHDGRATEFFVQTGTLPCGKQMGVVVGVSRLQPRMHTFGTRLHPDRPLVLRRDQWEALSKASSPITLTDWECDDHGSDFHWDLKLQANQGRIDATLVSYACKPGGQLGPVVETVEK